MRFRVLGHEHLATAGHCFVSSEWDAFTEHCKFAIPFHSIPEALFLPGIDMLQAEPVESQASGSARQLNPTTENLDVCCHDGTSALLSNLGSSEANGTQVLVTLIIFLISRKFHPSWGAVGHAVNAGQCRRGWEW